MIEGALQGGSSCSICGQRCSLKSQQRYPVHTTMGIAILIGAVLYKSRRALAASAHESYHKVDIGPPMTPVRGDNPR